MKPKTLHFRSNAGMLVQNKLGGGFYFKAKDKDSWVLIQDKDEVFNQALKMTHRTGFDTAYDHFLAELNLYLYPPDAL